MEEVARIPIWVKDTVMHEPGEWKFLKLFSFFISLARTDHSLCMRSVVKKWIHQYGVAVPKNSEICDFIESCSNTEKALLTSKRNSLVLFMEQHLHP